MGQTRRIQFQKILEEILGNENVYYQPPESIKLKYPCIIYEKSDIDVNYADDTAYSMNDLYLVTLIGRNPDTEIPYQILQIPSSSFDRRFVSDNLYHDIFRIYY